MHHTVHPSMPTKQIARILRRLPRLVALIAPVALAAYGSAVQAATLEAWGSCYAAEYYQPNQAVGCQVNSQWATNNAAQPGSQVTSFESGRVDVTSESGGTRYTATAISNGAGRASLGDLGVFATSFIAGKTRPNGGIAVDAQARAVAGFTDTLQLQGAPADGFVHLSAAFDVAEMSGVYNYPITNPYAASGSFRVVAEIGANQFHYRAEACSHCQHTNAPLHVGRNEMTLSLPFDEVMRQYGGQIQVTARLFAETKSLMWGAEGNSADTTVDAIHSLHFYVDENPGLAYTSESGARYAPLSAAVPEPDAWLMLAVGSGLLWVRRRALSVSR